MRLVWLFLLVGGIVGAVIGVIKGEGPGGILIEAATGGLIAGAASIGATTGKQRGRDHHDE